MIIVSGSQLISYDINSNSFWAKFIPGFITGLKLKDWGLEIVEISSPFSGLIPCSKTRIKGT